MYGHAYVYAPVPAKGNEKENIYEVPCLRGA